MFSRILDPRAEVVLRDDLITPMHHHTPGKDFLVAQTADGPRRVSVNEATRIVAAADSTPGVHDVDRVDGSRFSRRNFLRSGTIGAGALAVSAMTPRMSFAAGAQDLLVVCFLRGGIDGLSAIVPVTDSAYYNARPNIAVRPEETFALNANFGMNRNMDALKPLWDARQLAVVLGSGNPSITRSHFEDQTACEQAAPAAQRSGWIGRHLASSSSAAGTFRAIAMGERVAISLTTTAFETVAMSSVSEFDIYAWEGIKTPLLRSLDEMYAHAGGIARDQAHLTISAINSLAEVRNTPYTPQNGAEYPDHSFARGLKDIARMAKANVGLEAATVDFSDWDMHYGLGVASNPNDWFARNSRLLAQGLAAFARDLGSKWGTTTVVLMSEFGRRVEQNGDWGADHGHGNVLWALGGGIAGGVYGSQPSLSDGNLIMGDVPLTTDYRLPLAEIVTKRLGNGSSLGQVFPGYTPGAFLGVAR